MGKPPRTEEKGDRMCEQDGRATDRGQDPATAAIEYVLACNRTFTTGGAAQVERAVSSRPKRRLAVVACMDTRLTRMLPEAFGLDDGDSAIIKVAGATIVEPYGEAMRSLLVAVGELGVTDIMVVGHTDCGTCGMTSAHMMDALAAAGTPRDRIERTVREDPRAAEFLNGFSRLEDEVAANVRTIREHPLMPDSVSVSGFVIDIETGALTPVSA